jgi:hypothetical protein
LRFVKIDPIKVVGQTHDANHATDEFITTQTDNHKS